MVLNLVLDLCDGNIYLDVQVTYDGVPILFHDFAPQHYGAKTIGQLDFQEIVELHNELTNLVELREIPEPLIFNVEFKYPYGDDFELIPFCTIQDLKAYCDPIMNIISRWNRRMFFSSFSKEVCIYVKNFQKIHPVYFLCDVGDIDDSFEFVTSHHLDGMVCDSRCIFADESIIKQFKTAGLELYTYGELNNDESHIIRQLQLGLDGIITDSVYKALKSREQFIR